MRTYVRMVVYALIPRFELAIALGRVPSEDPGFPPKEIPALFEAVALAPEPDREQVVGDVSGAAEAVGVHAGMRLGEALARCPDLRLVAADPDGAAVAWERVLVALEGVGAAVESRRAG